MNRPSEMQHSGNRIYQIFEIVTIPNLNLKLIALPFLALQRKELFFEKTRSE